MNLQEDMTNLFQENMQLRVWIWIDSNLKQGKKDIVKHVLKWCNNSHLLVNIIKPRKLEKQKDILP